MMTLLTSATNYLVIMTLTCISLMKAMFRNLSSIIFFWQFNQRFNHIVNQIFGTYWKMARQDQNQVGMVEISDLISDLRIRDLKIKDHSNSDHHNVQTDKIDNQQTSQTVTKITVTRIIHGWIVLWLTTTIIITIITTITIIKQQQRRVFKPMLAIFTQ